MLIRSTKHRMLYQVRICDVYVRSMVFSTSQGTMGATGSSILTDFSTSILAKMIIENLYELK